jgi:hypothetical protein
VSAQAREDHQDLIHLKDIQDQDFLVQAVRKDSAPMVPAQIILASLVAVIRATVVQWVLA